MDNSKNYQVNTKPKDLKPREIYVEFGGDLSNDTELYKRYCSSEPFQPFSYKEEVVHFIEYSAYEELLKKI